MSMRRKPAIIGFFILGAGLVLALGVILFGGGRLLQKTTQAVIFFERSVAGLQIGAPVTFRGVKVGTVKRIALQFNPDTATARIPVYIEIGADELTVIDSGLDPDNVNVPGLVAKGLRAQLQLQSFVTGQLMVELDFKASGAAGEVRYYADVIEIPAVVSDLDRLKDTVSDLPVADTLVAARDAMQAIKTMSDAAEQQIAVIGTKTATAAQSAEDLMVVSRESLLALQADMSETLAELRALSQVARTQIDGRGQQLGVLLERTDKAVAKIDSIAAGVDDLVAPRSPVRRDMEAALRDLAGAASSLRSFADKIERNPNAVLLGSEKR